MPISCQKQLNIKKNAFTSACYSVDMKYPPEAHVSQVLLKGGRGPLRGGTYLNKVSQWDATLGSACDLALPHFSLPPSPQE